MVKSVIGGVTTLYVSASYQITAGVVTKYYPGGAYRVGSVLYYGYSDHLGSTNVTANSSGVKVSDIRYKAWGETRYSSGDPHTDKGYTGQRSFMDDFGLHYYNARWYDSYLNHFTQPDTIIPPGPQGLDRYAYANNNPVNFNDPTGHSADCSRVYSTARSACENRNVSVSVDELLKEFGITLDGDEYETMDL